MDVCFKWIKVSASSNRSREKKLRSGCIVALAKALHTTPNYLLMGETEEDPWAEDVMQILSEIKDPAMRKLAIDQLKCIARIS